MALIFTAPRYIPVTADGIVPGARLYFYRTGTSTPQAVYSDSALQVPHAQPVEAFDDGSFPVIYLDDSGPLYKVVLTDSTGEILPGGADPYLLGPTQAQIGAALYPRTDAESAAGVTPVNNSYPYGNVLRYGADPTGSSNSRDAFANAIAALGADGGRIDIPEGTYRFNSGITLSQATWTPIIFMGHGNSVIDSSSFNGTVFDDDTGNARFENIRFEGPGIAVATNTPTAIKSQMALGWVRGCRIQGYWFAIDINGSTAPDIERNLITGNHEGIHCVNVSPLFSNIIFIGRNWFSGNDYGAYFDEVYGLILDTNTWESNSVGFFANSCREMEVRGNNWFESNSTNAFQIDGASTGFIGRETHIVGNSYTVDYTTSRIQDLRLQATCIVKNAGTQSIGHNSETALAWDTEVLDPSGMHSTSVNSQNIVIACAGLYEITATLELASVATPGAGTVGRLTIKKSGTDIKSVKVPMSDAQATQLCVSFLEECANGVTLTAYAYQNSGGSINASGGNLSGFSARLVSTD